MCRYLSCFSCAILWTVTPPSYSNRTVPSVVQLSFTLTFFLPSFSQNIVWSEYYFVRIKRHTASTFKITTAYNGWWRGWQATRVHCELLVAIPVITHSLRKSRRDLDTDIRHPKSFCCAFKTSPLYVSVFTQFYQG